MNDHANDERPTVYDLRTDDDFKALDYGMRRGVLKNREHPRFRKTAQWVFQHQEQLERDARSEGKTGNEARALLEMLAKMFR